jgi:hypothetical protein
MTVSRSWLGKLAFGLCVSIYATLGCTCSKQDKQDTSDPAVAQKEENSASTAGGDPLWAQIRSLASSCDVNASTALLKCKDNEQRKLITDFARKGKARIDSIKTLATALSDKDPKIQTVAANILHLAFRSSFGNDVNVGDVSPESAKALIAAVAVIPKPQASRAMPATVHAAMLSGQTDALYKMLDGRAGDKLDLVAYRYLMTHGRLTAFPKVKELVKSDQLPVALAALASPTAMRNWSKDEQAQICPWARDLLDDDRTAIGGRAARLLSNCSGEYVDTLLQKGEELFKAGKLGQAQIPSFRDICGPGRRKSPELVSEAQCARNRQLLEKTLLAPATDPKTKVLVLSALVYQWPDASVLELAQKLSKDPDKDLARQASDTVRRLHRKGVKG